MGVYCCFRHALVWIQELAGRVEGGELFVIVGRHVRPAGRADERLHLPEGQHASVSQETPDRWGRTLETHAGVDDSGPDRNSRDVWLLGAKRAREAVHGRLASAVG